MERVCKRTRYVVYWPINVTGVKLGREFHLVGISVPNEQRHAAGVPVLEIHKHVGNAQVAHTLVKGIAAKHKATAWLKLDKYHDGEYVC